VIEIYLKTNTNYAKNGDITLDPTKCVYKDSENEVTLEHFLDEDGRWKYIDLENVIAAEENGKKKLFRIYNIVRSLYSVTAYARPIFYDLIDKVLLDVRPTNKLGQEALNIILENTGFTGHSNLTTLSTSYYIRKNIVEALLGDEENSFLNRWGGEFYCENFDVYINDRIGSDNGVRVEFGYNLNEIEEDVNIEDVVTRIIPTGFDGIMLEGNTPWIDSPLIKKYEHIKMRVINFSDVKVKENSDDEEGFNTIEEARAELINRCNKLYEEDLDKPTVNYKIDMINLANTTAYKDFKMLVNVNKGDTVTCYIPHLDINVKARVIDYQRDLLTGEYNYIELGNAERNFFNDQADIQTTINKITNSNGTVNAGEIQGVINAIQTQFKALKDVAQPQDVRAMLFEDRVEDSPTFGCMCLGTMGFEIASSFKPGTKQWDFRTFGTGQGFIADHIVAGILSTILIQNADGSLQIDLSSTKGIMTKKNGKNAIELAGTIMKFYDWDGREAIGQLYSSRVNGNESVPGISLVNKVNSFLSLEYERDNNFYSYMRFDKDNIDNVTKVPITFFQEAEFRGSQMWFGYDINSIYNSATNNFVNKVKNNFIISDKDSAINRLNLGKSQLNLYDVTDNGNRYALISPSETFFGANGKKYFSSFPNGFSFSKNGDDILYTTTSDGIRSEKSIYIDKDLTVVGNKNCVQSTENYGDRLYYSVEDCESYLTDRSMHLFSVEEVVTDGVVTYERVILLDSIFKESVRCDLDYTVEVIKQGWGDYRIKEQNKNYFIVESDREDFTFKYIVTAKRTGFELVRNEELYIGCKGENNTTDTEYWRLYINKNVSENL
jgi:phage minor structural protein